MIEVMMTPTAEPTRVVADVDVLVADVFIDGDARRALDHVRGHSWLEWYVSEALVELASGYIASLGDEELAAGWNDRVRRATITVDHPTGDHPALATANSAKAGHVLSYDEGLRSAKTALALRDRLATSVKHPRGFVRLFDPATLYEATQGAPYPGPDRDPRD